MTTANADTAPDLIPSDDIDITNPADLAKLAELTGQPIPADEGPAQAIVAAFRAAQKEMTRRRNSHRPLVLEIREEAYRLMVQDTPEGHEARRLCSDISQSGWMVGVGPIDYTTATPPPKGDPTRTAFPTVVQQAIDYGRNLPSVDVCTSDWRGIPGGDYIEVDFIISIQDDSIELGTVWCPDPDGWTLVGGSWRTFSRQDRSFSLDTWDDVRALLDNHATNP